MESAKWQLEADREVLSAYRAGQPDALQRVYERYMPEIRRYLQFGFAFSSGGSARRYRGARSTFDLEDRLHDVFDRAFGDSARLGYDGISPFLAYLRAIAKNMIIDDFRKKEHALLDYSVEELPDRAGETASNYAFMPETEPGPQARAEDQELKALVRRFKAQLPARELQVYQLRFEEGLEHKAIADRTGLSESKLKTSEERIRKRFYWFMRKNGYFAGYQQRKGGWLQALRGY